jgi:hypothetical protein
MLKRKMVKILSLSLLIIGSGFSVFNFVHADDEYEQDDDAVVETTTSVAPSVTKKQTTKTVTQTVVVTPEMIVTENQIQTISLPDRDRDGIPDGEDAHPDIAEIYIVKDENLNGVVDTFE